MCAYQRTNICNSDLTRNNKKCRILIKYALTHSNSRLTSIYYQSIELRIPHSADPTLNFQNDYFSFFQDCRSSTLVFFSYGYLKSFSGSLKDLKFITFVSIFLYQRVLMICIGFPVVSSLKVEFNCNGSVNDQHKERSARECYTTSSFASCRDSRTRTSTSRG